MNGAQEAERAPLRLSSWSATFSIREVLLPMHPISYGARIPFMPTQVARLAKLRAVVAKLEREGLSSPKAQARYLGDVVTQRRLQAMLEGGRIDTLFAAHVEHVLLKPRGWMSESTEALSREHEIEHLSTMS